VRGQLCPFHALVCLPRGQLCLSFVPGHLSPRQLRLFLAPMYLLSCGLCLFLSRLCPFHTPARLPFGPKPPWFHKKQQITQGCQAAQGNQPDKCHGEPQQRMDDP
jgi:hypothetical protein